MRVEVYCDGAAINNGRAGSIGFAAVLFAKEAAQEYSGGMRADPASSNRAELLAIDLGLTKLGESGHRDVEVLVCSDSEWSIKALKGEYQVSAHTDLIQQIRSRLRTFVKAELMWVRGHVGHRMNERAHTLANHEARKAWSGREKEPEAVGKRQQVTTAEVQMSQARLDLICRPTPHYYRAYVRWINRFTAQAVYTSEELLCRRYEIGPRIAQLKRELLETDSPEELPELDRKLKTLEGQAAAIDETLQRRNRAVPRTAPSPQLVSSTSSTGQRRSSETPAPGPDPFSAE